MNLADLAAKVNAAMEEDLGKTTDKAEELYNKNIIKEDNEKLDKKLVEERASICDIDAKIKEKKEKAENLKTKSYTESQSASPNSSTSDSSTTRSNPYRPYNPYGYHSSSTSSTTDKEKEKREQELKKEKEITDKLHKSINRKLKNKAEKEKLGHEEWDIFTLQRQQEKINKKKQEKIKSRKKSSSNKDEFLLNILSACYKTCEELYVKIKTEKRSSRDV